MKYPKIPNAKKSEDFIYMVSIVNKGEEREPRCNVSTLKC